MTNNELVSYETIKTGAVGTWLGILTHKLLNVIQNLLHLKYECFKKY